MTEHYDEELSSLLSGELTGEETRAVVAHLRECGPCTSALISVAVAHGALRAARRAMTPPVASAPAVAPTPELAPLVLPPRHRGRWVGALAAALVLVGGTLGGLAVTKHTPTSPPLAAVASLHHLDAPVSAVGDVTVHATAQELEMLVSTRGLPSAPANHFYEVWLLAPQTNKMLPLGVLSATGTGTYSISATIMRQFSDVDISLQDNNGIAQHSNTSVLRGTVTAV